MIEPPLCVALDVPTIEEASALARRLAGTVRLFKVGFELFCSEGPKAVRDVHDTGASVFLDLKINDIPRTAAAAVRQCASLGATYVTIHGFGGRDMIRAAVEASQENRGPQLLVVSALTSFDDQTLAEVGVKRGVREHALAVGRMAAEEGAEGLILSPRELDVVRPALPHLLLATPGVRPSGTGEHDHRRTLTPAEAVLRGADMIVVGRPILQAPDPVAAARAIVEEIEEAEAQRERRRAAEESASIEEVEDAELEDVDVALSPATPHAEPPGGTL